MKERDQVKLPADRCPYCHEGVERGDVNKVACNACMAWHHAQCWQEHRACSACGAAHTGFSKTPQTAAPIRPQPIYLGVALAIVIPVLTFLALWAYNDNIEILDPGTFENVVALSVLVGAALGVGCAALGVKGQGTAAAGAHRQDPKKNS